MLIVGSDSRGDLKAGEGTQGTGKDFVTGQRSDTVILAHLYGDTDKAQLVSFPRDSWVTIPDFTDPESGKVVAEHEGKLNSAFFEGGPPLLIRTLERMSQLRIDNYLQIDFDGFQRMVNTLGGVEVCLSKPAKEKDSGIDLPAGRQTIKGDQALAFVRQRKGLPNGDIDRIARQQQFIGAIVRKTLSAGTLLNPFKLKSTVDVATESLQVDETLSIGRLFDLAHALPRLRRGRRDLHDGARRRHQRLPPAAVGRPARRAEVPRAVRPAAPRRPPDTPDPDTSTGPSAAADRRSGCDPREGLQRRRRRRPRAPRLRRPGRGRLPARRRARRPRHERHVDDRLPRRRTRPTRPAPWPPPSPAPGSSSTRR